MNHGYQPDLPAGSKRTSHAARGGLELLKIASLTRGAKSIALLTAIYMLVSCAVAPTIRSANFVLADAWLDGSPIAPGARTRIVEVSTTDDKGSVTVLSDPASYSVEVEGGTWDRATGEVAFSRLESKIPATGYAITVIPSIAPEIRVVKRFVADWALVKGPEPDDLQSFDVKLIWKDEQGRDWHLTDEMSLIPGAEYRLLITAHDKAGRKFSTDGLGLPLPSARVPMRLLLLTAKADDWTSLAAVESAFETTTEFRIEASYGGDDRFARVLTFPYDPAIADGPDSLNVSSIEILGQLADDSRPVPPGSTKPMNVRVTDVSGTSWLLSKRDAGSHVTREYVLPQARIDVQVDHGEYIYDEKGPRVTFSPDAKAMFGRKFGVQVVYRNNPQIAVHKEFEPDFLSIVPIMTTNELIFGGPKGRDGADGRDGQNGNEGRRGTKQLGRGGGGSDGRHGSHGQDGGRGGPGPDVRIIAGEVRTVDYEERLVVFEVREGGLTPKYLIRRFDDVNVRIFSVGGAGGNGGRGGNGGHGGDGGEGYFSGNGGNGGDGGNGGNGGDGGNGGHIYLISATAELERKFALSAAGGLAGVGGQDGTPGAAGAPGSIDVWEKDSDPKEPPSPGSHGSEGNFGHVGHNGNDGLSTPPTLEDNSEEFKDLLDGLPNTLRSVINW